MVSSKGADFEIRTTISRCVCKLGDFKFHHARLFVDYENVAVESGTFRGTRTDVVRQDDSFREVSSGNIANKPMVPLSVLRIAATWCVWI